MSNSGKGSFLKNNWFFFTMIIGIVLGIVVGFAWPGATALEPLGTLFINMMFCVVVPMVFFSISSAIDGHHGPDLHVHHHHRLRDHVRSGPLHPHLHRRARL